MRFLAINTAAKEIEIAVCFDELKISKSLPKAMAAEQLLPLIDEILNESKIDLDKFEHFVCVTGPGSFTGIRIGVNTVRAFAYALKKQSYGVTFNRVMSYMHSGKVMTVVDGNSGVRYIAAFDGEELVLDHSCVYAKDVVNYVPAGYRVVSDCETEGIESQKYVPDGEALLKAAEYAIKNKLSDEPLYIRKAQPDRKEGDI